MKKRKTIQHLLWLLVKDCDEQVDVANGTTPDGGWDVDDPDNWQSMSDNLRKIAELLDIYIEEYSK